MKKQNLFTRYALLHRGAEYFKMSRLPRVNWKTIDDLSPQLAEFELRYAGQDFDTATQVLLEIDFDYLDLWGHYRLMMNFHERLQGKIDDSELKLRSLGNLGTAYLSMAQYHQAISCYQNALNLAREEKHRQGEAALLGNLGNCYYSIGQITSAIEYYEQALAIDREIRNRQGEAADLGNLGICYADLDQNVRVIEYYEQALVIAREIGYRQGEGSILGNLGNYYADSGQIARAIEYHELALEIDHQIGNRQGEGIRLGNLGNRYAELGQIARAIECYVQALEIAREIGDLRVEAIHITNLGDVRLLENQLNIAIKNYQQAIQIADEIGLVQAQNEARYGMTLAFLITENLLDAERAIKECKHYHYPPNDHQVLALQGIIAIRQGDHKIAHQAFNTAIKEAERLLTHSEKNFKALDTKALAFCGLVLCEKRHEYIKEAEKLYQSAREIIKAPGVVTRVLRLFDELAKADKEGILKEVRAVAAGEK